MPRVTPAIMHRSWKRLQVHFPVKKVWEIPTYVFYHEWYGLRVTAAAVVRSEAKKILLLL